jgi:hypothetical protein
MDGFIERSDMENAIAKLKSAHDKIMRITISAQDSIQFSSGILELRQAIAELESETIEEEDKTTE